MSKRLPVIWDAEPHTIAKIEILKSYLQAWFRILGKTRPGETILYVDGFSGPGYYKNHDEGSPLAAMRVASKAIHSLNETFVASRLHCAFIESHPERFAAMAETIAPLECNPSIGTSKFLGTFVEGIKRIRQEVPEPFNGKGPLFIFADPFGGTEIPFKTFAECMKSDTSELLINLDADGIRVCPSSPPGQTGRLHDCGKQIVSIPLGEFCKIPEPGAKDGSRKEVEGRNTVESAILN